MKIIFLGTPEIAVPSLSYLIQKEDIEILAVVSQPNKPVGRGLKLCTTAICTEAICFDIPVFQPQSIRKDPELIKKLKDLQPDFFITFAFGQILSQEVLDIPKYGTINLHASLLPKYRGANPIQAPIVNGDKFTGITTMLTEIGVDTGAIVLQKEIEITENMTTPELTEIISKLSPKLLYESLKGLYEEKIVPVAQNNNEVTHAPKVSKEDGMINWEDSTENIHNKVRAFKPWPSTFTYINGCCIKITETKINASLNIEENIKKNSYGEITGKINNGIGVVTGNGIITVTKVQPAGKKEMDALSWFNGARLPKESKFTPVCEGVCEIACDLSDN